MNGDAQTNEFASSGSAVLPGGTRRVDIKRYARAGGITGKKICQANACSKRRGSSFHLATFRIGDIDVCTAAAKKWAKRFPGARTFAPTVKAAG